ncbi:MAG: CPBP family intramembrane metalloprotease [Akkermansiaceae bacterium]|nr:CPBP family intramembrane metalloprotease [Akkermansiaceae bacterium]
MKRFFQSEAGAAGVFILMALLLASAAAPWAFQFGKSYAHYVAAHDLSAFQEWLGKACGRSKLERYFSRSLLVSVLILLPFLFARIRVIRRSNEPLLELKRSLTWTAVASQVALGCAIAGGILLGLGMILEVLGAYAIQSKHANFINLLSRILMPAVVVSLLEEWIFRGLLLGFWLRYTRPVTACIATSFVFAFVHFLAPPAGQFIANPAAPTAGFKLLGKILLHFTDPTFFVTDFATLFVIGMILAWARLRTGALWFSIGLHAGWIAAFKGFSMLHSVVPNHPLRPWGVGESLRSGLLPMLALVVTAVVCHIAMNFIKPVSAVSRASP